MRSMKNGFPAVVLVMALVALSMLTLVHIAAAADTPTPLGAPDKTLRAPTTDLADVQKQIGGLIDAKQYDQAASLCQQGYDSSADSETRAFYLRSLATVKDRSQAYDQAITLYQQVIAQYPQSIQVSWAKYYLASCYLAKAKQTNDNNLVTQAITVLAGFLKDYPNHERADRAARQIARCYEQGGNTEAAIAQYLKVVDLYPKYPGTPHVGPDGSFLQVLQVQSTGDRSDVWQTSWPQGPFWGTSLQSPFWLEALHARQVPVLGQLAHEHVQSFDPPQSRNPQSTAQHFRPCRLTQAWL